MIRWIRENIIWYFFSAKRPKRVGAIIIDQEAFDRKFGYLFREDAP